MSTIDSRIADFAAGILVRYFRRGEFIQGTAARINARRDFEILKCHWSISPAVQSFVRYVIAHPHEAQALLTYRTRVDSAVVRGRIDALRTWIYQRQTAIPTATVSHEPVRSFANGPNLLVAWVLNEVQLLSNILRTWQHEQSPYQQFLAEAESDLRSMQRIEFLREPLRDARRGRRPGSAAVRDAARARRPLYQYAVTAFQLLEGLEHQDEEAIRSVVRTSMISPLESWRRFELAAALAVGEALARATGADLEIELLGTSANRPLVRTPRFAVYWQLGTEFYRPAPLEPTEVALRDALAAYGVRIGNDRPDIVVVDRLRNEVAAIVEVKYVSGDTVTGRFADAVGQLVRYCRNYETGNTDTPLLETSMVVLSHDAPERERTFLAPYCCDFGEFMQPRVLDAWAQAVLVRQQA